MLNSSIKYDYGFMAADKVGKYGFKKAELLKLASQLKLFNQKLKQEKDQPELSFRKLPYDKKNLKQVLKLAKKLQGRFDNLVVVGIGGSDLGARAIYQALTGSFASFLPKKWRMMKIYFCGNTTDPQPLADLLKVIDIRKTVFYVVSKSGETVEPLSCFLFLRKKVIGKVGYKKHQEHFIVTTDLKDNALLEIAKKEGYKILPHFPGSGRFSILSVNSLLPAACAGLDIRQLLTGAKVMDRLSKSNNYQNNLPFLFAALQYLAYKNRKQNISVIMPYAYSLRDFAFWARQHLGESLNKKYNLAKKIVNIGISYIAALGPTDQHSQIQLYIEGPNNKIITFIKVARPFFDIKIPEYKNSEIAYLGGHKFSKILNIEQRTTAVSLVKNKRPNGTIILPILDEYYLGQLFFFFELATLYLGKLLQINVFDQPGVEQSKRYMYGLLGRKGYEKEKREILSL